MIVISKSSQELLLLPVTVRLLVMLWIMEMIHLGVITISVYCKLYATQRFPNQCNTQQITSDKGSFHHFQGKCWGNQEEPILYPRMMRCLYYFKLNKSPPLNKIINFYQKINKRQETQDNQLYSNYQLHKIIYVMCLKHFLMGFFVSTHLVSNSLLAILTLSREKDRP